MDFLLCSVFCVIVLIGICRETCPIKCKTYNTPLFSIQQLLVVFKSFFIFVRFCLEAPPGLQRMYNRASTPPPTKVTCLSDKEQKDWVKDVQGITEQ